MESEKIISKADIRRTPKTPEKILIVIWYILGVIAFYIGTFGMSYTSYDDGEIYHREYYLFFMPFYTYRNKYYFYTNSGDRYNVGFLLLGILITIVVIILPIIIRKIANSMANQCSLTLTDKTITGCRKNLFSSKALKLPIDKIDAIMASHSIFDSLRGGETLLIRSASGVVKFPWVQNAGEFVSAALSEIEKFKQSASKENHNLVASALQNAGNPAVNSSAAQKIKELKDLLDSGLITQEEFEAKRKSLIDKI